jgi:flagellar biosynthetic protein FliR
MPEWSTEALIGWLAPLIGPWVLAFALALGRVGGALLALPQLRASGVPPVAQAAIAVAFAAAIVAGAPLPPLRLLGATPELGLAIALVGEIAVGLAIGFMVHVLLGAMQVAGELIGVEMGLSFAAVADPITRTQSTAAASLVGQLGLQLMLALGLDHLLVRELAHSAQVLPLGAGTLSGATMGDLAARGRDVLSVGLSLALPVMGPLFALKAGMALLARVAPRLQLFTLVFAMSAGVGMIALEVALPHLSQAIADHYRQLAHDLRALVLALAPAT